MLPTVLFTAWIAIYGPGHHLKAVAALGDYRSPVACVNAARDAQLWLKAGLTGVGYCTKDLPA